MNYSGTILFPNSLSEELWNGLLQQHDLSAVTTAELVNPATGDTVTIQDPPNLLGKHADGIVRFSRYYLSEPAESTAEISFEGTGPDFQQLIASLAGVLNGEVHAD